MVVPVGLLLLAACGSASESVPSDGVIRLTYWSAQNPQEQQLAEYLVRGWNAEHPGVQVLLQPLPAGQSSEEVLLAAIVARTTPDICSNIWPGIMSDFIRARGVLRLDTFPDFDSLMQSRVPAELIDGFRAVDGGLYQIPWKTNPIMMLYNRSLFEAAGIRVMPRTYSEFLSGAAKLTVDRDGDGQLDQWAGYRRPLPIWHERRFDYYAFYIGASGGKTLFEDGEIRIDTAASNAVFSFFHSLYANKYFPLTTFQSSPILSGKVATEFVGPWQIGWLEENAPQGFEYGFAPLPLPDDYEGPAYTFGDFKNIVIFADTKHPQEAWEFAKYLVSKEADLKLLEYSKQIPVRSNLLGDSTYAPFFASNPSVIPFAEQAERTLGEDGVGSLQEILDAIAQEFEAGSVYGVYPPAEATRRAIARIKLIREWDS
ncbi:MAG: sugar ABC transporter substrate-binding protein [Rhodothermia bacterium]|nr:sugar ABC transporter substrate-binding protein [Rhodothermia bacterium]